MYIGAAESLGSVGELPHRVGQQLKHLVKQRPRRPKTRQARRPVGALAAALQEEDITRGVDTFFRGDGSAPSTPLLLSPMSEHSGRLGKYEWSSMDSFPGGGAAGPSVAEGGSGDSLSRWESAAHDSGGTTRDSPSSGAAAPHDTDDEDTNAVFDECHDVPRRRTGTGSSMGGLPRVSPDRAHRNTFTALLDEGDGEAPLSLQEEKVAGMAGLVGLGYGGNFMAEISKRAAGGSVQVECRVCLGPLQDRVVKTLRVRMRDNFFSISGDRGARKCIVASFMAAAMLAAARLYFDIS
ncbi:uncharacterized protein LOC125179118 [Hyalella azteca]|uniref:Uncharacterized protein LOC125179118 n=1 Tax=Hyalella azteca TaxID=294128 RepID=A0A979FW60_HYAAZ|nr:uncharacterized protein LOC125179118 [Hyalella azteca]